MDQIFVKIASYRDAELPKTIRSALKNAKYPKRVTFGICWQYDELTYLDLDPFIDSDNFRVYQTYYENSKGCCWARHQTDQLYGGEEYMLQIDAHTRFAPDWDERFISMLTSLDADKPVISTYPAPFKYIDGVEHQYTDRGMQRLQVKNFYRNLTTVFETKRLKDRSKPVKSKFLGAGQLFTYGRFCHEVEYDPELYFMGEEISLAARAYTQGYDFYCPNEDLLWHHYQHSMPVHSLDHADNQQSKAMERLRELFIEDSTKLGKYGFGTVRSLADYEEFAGLDFKERYYRKQIKTHLKATIPLDLSNIEERDDYDFWIFSLRNVDDDVIYRKDLKPHEFPSRQSPSITLDLELPDKPVSYGLWPHTTNDGYLTRQIEAIKS